MILYCLHKISDYIFCNNLKYWNRQACANSVDPDQMPHNVASDQCLHCLPYIQQYFRHISSKVEKVVKWNVSSFRASMVSS